METRHEDIVNTAPPFTRPLKQTEPALSQLAIGTIGSAPTPAAGAESLLPGGSSRLKFETVAQKTCWDLSYVAEPTEVGLSRSRFRLVLSSDAVRDFTPPAVPMRKMP